MIELFNNVTRSLARLTLDIHNCSGHSAVTKMSCHAKTNSNQTFSIFFRPRRRHAGHKTRRSSSKLVLIKSALENSVRERDPSSLSIKVSGRESRWNRKKKEKAKRKKVWRRERDAHSTFTFNQCQPRRSKCRRSRHTKNSHLSSPPEKGKSGWAMGTGGRESTNSEKMLKSATVVTVINSLGGPTNQPTQPASQPRSISHRDLLRSRNFPSTVPTTAWRVGTRQN